MGRKLGSLRPILMDGPFALVELTQGYFSGIDSSDIELVNKNNWHVSIRRTPNSMGGTVQVYAVCERNGKSVQMHRMLKGVTDPDVEVDHWNRDTLDNRRDNLRVCIPGLNGANKAFQCNNKCGYKGVRLHECGRWTARIQKDKKLIYLGLFEDAISAAMAYDEAAIRLFGEFALTNFSMGLVAA